MVINKRAQIGETFIWMVAIIIIFCILAFYVAFSGFFLLPSTPKNSLTLVQDHFAPVIDISNVDLAKNFYSSDKEDIFKWADSEAVLTKGDLIQKNNPEAQKIYDDFLNSYTTYLKDKGLKNPVFYIRTYNKELQINKASDTRDLYSEFVQTDGKTNFIYNMKYNPDVPEYDYIHRFFIATDKGTLVMVIFYDKAQEVAKLQ